MKKLYFSALMFCGSFITMQVYGQTASDIDAPAAAGQGASEGFTAYPENNIVVFRWQPAYEGNTDHFVIEHASDTVHFTELHSLVAKGNIGQSLAYEDEDSYPAAQPDYYRLKIVTRDGDAFYSPVVMVDMTGKTVLTIKPTVVHMGSTLRVDIDYHQPVTIDFFNEGGMRTASYLVNSTSFNINASDWGKGIYFYRISDPGHPMINSGKIMMF